MSKSSKIKRPSDSKIEHETSGKSQKESSDTTSSYFTSESEDVDEDVDEQDEASVDDAVTSVVAAKKLTKAFFEKSCEDLAKALLGQVLVRIHNGKRLAGKIIETEAYLGRRDKAAHSYKGKTDRNTAMFMAPGTAYVYNIHGYCCMNISSHGEGEAVLIRALEPLEGKSVMTPIRAGNRKKKSAAKPMKEKDLCNGPSKLTQALSITKNKINQVDLPTSSVIWLERGEQVLDCNVVASKRINIAYAEEWRDKLLRYYELGNSCVSRRDKVAEKSMQQTGS